MSIKITKQDWMPLNYVHMALCTGLVLFGLLTFYLKNFKFDYDLSLPDYIVLGAAVVTQVISVSIAPKLISLTKNDPLNIKFNNYRRTKIVHMALTEGVALFGLVNFIIDDSIFLPIISALLLLRLFTLKPSKDNFIQLFELNADERRDLN